MTIFPNRARFEWPFYISAGVAWVGATGWGLVVGPVEQVDWDKAASPKPITPMQPSAQTARP